MAAAAKRVSHTLSYTMGCLYWLSHAITAVCAAMNELKLRVYLNENSALGKKIVSAGFVP